MPSPILEYNTVEYNTVEHNTLIAVVIVCPQDFDRAAHCLGATDVVMTDLFGVAADTEDKGEEKTALSVDDQEKLSEIRVCLIATHKQERPPV